MKIALNWFERLFSRLGQGTNEADSADDWDIVRDDSKFACAARMFRRAQDPLDGVDPDLAGLLADNRDRDILLNERLTTLAGQTAAWRALAAACHDRISDLEPQLHAVQARAEAAETLSRSYREALTHLEARYVASVLSEFRRLDALLVERAGEPVAPSGRASIRAKEADDALDYRQMPKPRLIWPKEEPSAPARAAPRRPSLALRA